MERPTDKSASRTRRSSRRLWYVPDRRIRTEAAAREAVAISERVAGRGLNGNKPDEHALFAALHACAYRASGRSRGGRRPARERSEWARRWRQIREYIVERNLGLAHSMVRRFGSTKVDEDDLLSDALLGLTLAADRFNPWKGYRFSTYACNVIARALMRRGKREGGYRRLFPVQFDDSFERPERMSDFRTELHIERLTHVLDGNVGGLTDVESRILDQRFPKDGTGRPTFQEIGDAIGLSKERVRQVQNIALRKLRDVLEADPALQ